MSERSSKAEPIILCDTREQLPLMLPNFRRATLVTGDYSVEGYEELIAVERKTLEDLYGCFGQSRERFVRELDRLAAYRYPAIVIEASLAQVVAGARYSQVQRNRVTGRLGHAASNPMLAVRGSSGRGHSDAQDSHQRGQVH